MLEVIAKEVTALPPVAFAENVILSFPEAGTGLGPAALVETDALGACGTVVIDVDAEVVPTPPAVTDNCGRTVTPTLTNETADQTCSGTKTYTFTYTDCSGATATWDYVYTISAPIFSKFYRSFG